MNAGSLLASLAPRRIAVFRALQLGDMLCSVPALRALREAAPQAHIALIGLPWAQSFVERYADLVDELIVFPGAEGFPEQRESNDGLPAFHEQMRARRFDLAIQLHGSGGVANDLLLQFGASSNAGFVQPQEQARDGVFIDWPDDLPEPERYLALMSALGAETRDRQLWFPLSERDGEEYASLVAAHGIEAQRLVLIHPGAQLPSRRWPAARFAEVADRLAAGGWQIAITGTAAEASLTGEVLGAMTAPALHLAGATSLGGLAALVAHARLVVCNDTGISHIAAATATASVVIASGSDTQRWAPLDHALHRVLADYPLCRPCMFRECPYGHPCALNIGVDLVVETALAQLAGVHGAHPAAPYALHTQAETGPFEELNHAA
ncbi:glycosyltransferase family 9 protein [bacterium M00.F.Ca.ET.228.01.1.1]|uniref:glycosyltransferase family 9 protein n=1 Tax=Paraburkholderia phenoliruptrix TaxID=252970 RepID=UPI00109319F2|nr:glycosyltransferase family 9 protein [Paraburkholderia phenoliruptrix]TGP45944.1 glycosyltransferase family 9 protein [bacterium M00.F.Ca.ET.228.01.1.1]TGS04143.1 glycosyltransferase family 9 protein [bacterium M00.F.Ca.ET.191.01.1.1]TGU07237.1 glycosyltransferase family 9 protein [bacterium M00.F.Ca.ET.155.01.1.1]MBW0446472.1 glycosyltransferase family 9 protein [Paraburkholderia phenoliruptrix]MBW9097102.1 glycosyltransferase family 9 protein [Paraburkholderia phenoliruptrix]